jgi:type II secretion system protein N
VIRLSPERLRLLRSVGLRAGFGLLVFIIAFYLSFPYNRLKDQAVALASQRNLDVEIASAGPVFGVGVAFHDITVATRPTDGAKPTRLRIDGVRVHLSPLSRLIGEDAFSVSADALGGDIDIDWAGSKTNSRLEVKSEDLAMAELPGVKETINLPLAGTLGLSLDLEMPTNKLATSVGSMRWACAGCAIGDGKAKLKVAGNPMLSEGLSLPRLKLGDFTGRITFDKGVGKLQAVQARSPDGELYVEGEVRLADPLPFSQIDLYVRFRLSDALLKSSEKLKLILQLVEGMGKRADGFYGLRLQGTLARLGPPQWSKSSPFTSTAVPPPPRSGASARQAAATAGRITGGGPITPPPPGRYDQPVDPLKNPNANLPRYPLPENNPPPAATPPVAAPGPSPPPSTPPPPPPPAPSPAAPTPTAPVTGATPEPQQPDSGGNP